MSKWRRTLAVFGHFSSSLRTRKRYTNQFFWKRFQNFWYVYLFRVNQAQERWPKTERVVHHLLMAETQYRSSRA